MSQSRGTAAGTALAAAALAVLLTGTGCVPGSAGTRATAGAAASGSAAPDLAAALGPALEVPSHRGPLTGSVSVVTPDSGWSDAVWAAADLDQDGMSDVLWHGSPGQEGTSYAVPAVTGLTVGPNGWLWAVAAFRVLAFDGRQWRPLFDGGASVDVEGSPVVTRDGTAWIIGAGTQTLRYDGRLRTYPAPDAEVCICGPLAAVSATGTVLQGGGDPGWGTSAGACLMRLDGGRWVPTAPDLGTTRVGAYALAADPLGRIWAWFHGWDDFGWGKRYLVGMALGSSLDGIHWVTYDSPTPTGTAWSMAAFDGTVWAVFGEYRLLEGSWLAPAAPGTGPGLRLYRLDEGTGRWTEVVVRDDRGRAADVQRVLAATYDGAWVVTTDGTLLRAARWSVPS